MSASKTYIIAILCLIIGAAIYALCRVDIIFLEVINDPFRLMKYSPSTSKAYYFIVYCLPDMLWYMSLLLIQHQLLTNLRASKIVLYIAIILPFILEGLQYLQIIPGTFDWWDTLCYLLTLILFLCVKNLFLSSHCK